MKLAVWIKENGLTCGSFAKRIGRTRQAVHRYCTDQRIPRPDDMAEISAATGGSVTIADFYGSADPAPTSQSEVA